MLSLLLYNQVLSPFSNIIYYFITDLGGLKGVSKLIAWQAVKSLSSNLPILPHILLVFNISLPTFNKNIAELKFLALITEIMQNFKQYSKAEDINIDLKAYFYSICVLKLNLSISLVKYLFTF